MVMVVVVMICLILLVLLPPRLPLPWLVLLLLPLPPSGPFSPSSPTPHEPDCPSQTIRDVAPSLDHCSFCPTHNVRLYDPRRRRTLHFWWVAPVAGPSSSFAMAQSEQDAAAGR